MVNRRDTQGAALIIVIAIMAVLTAIAVTFLSVTRQDMETATNVNEGVKGDLLGEAALAFAQYSLNKDLLDHPNVTSNDHAWKTIYDGRWAAGKQWARRGGLGLNQGGLPEINLSNMPLMQITSDLTGTNVVYEEELYRGPRSKNWLHIPRFEGLQHVIYLDPINYPFVQFVYADGAVERLDASTNFVRFDPALHPFVTSDFYGRDFFNGASGAPLAYASDNDSELYPREQIHLISDVDNDNDGLRDAIWVPIPADLFFNIDGVDNDLDSYPLLDAAGNPVIDPATGLPFIQDLDEANEAGTFVYHGLGNFLIDPESGDLLLDNTFQPMREGDGFDNDGNGFVDDAAENRLFLTTPLPGRVLPVDMNGDGIFDSDDYVLDTTTNTYVPLEVILPNTIPVRTRNPVTGATQIVTLTAADVDALDNDYDLFINDYVSYAYIPRAERDGVDNDSDGLTDEPDESLLATSGYDGSLHEYARVNLGIPYPSGAPLRNSLRFSPQLNSIDQTSLSRQFQSRGAQAILTAVVISHSGEPVCELAGRAAITITDESAKVNLNTAGGRNYDPLNQVTLRTAGTGATPYEYETRALPNVGLGKAADLWQSLMGDPFNGTNVVGNPFYWDMNLPGYGRVDDNGNALIAAMNNVDDDGDGLIDEGIRLPAISEDAQAMARGYYDDTSPFVPGNFTAAEIAALDRELTESRYAEYFAQLGIFEGIDEPAELYRFSPLRNHLAEGLLDIDTLDNDGDGVVNEFRELADIQFQNREHALSVGLNGPDIARLASEISVHSTSRNVQHVDTRSGVRALNKLDYNFATPQQIATQFMLSAEFEPLSTRGDIYNPLGDLGTGTPGNLRLTREVARNFAEGLRTAHAHTRAPAIPGSTTGTIPGGGLLHVRPEIGEGDWNANQQYPATYFWPTDPQLRALQTAVDIVDNRDAGNARSRLTTEKIDRIPSRTPIRVEDPLRAPEFWNGAPWPNELNPREVVPDDAILPLEEIELHASLTLDMDGKILQSTDQWWGGQVIGDARDVNDLDGDNNRTEFTGQPEERHISYTAAGTEAIRINELMVRPVRRVEAEATPDALNFDSVSYGTVYSPFFDPSPIAHRDTFGNLLDPSQLFNTGQLVSILPEFFMQRRTLETLGGSTRWTPIGDVIGPNAAMLWDRDQPTAIGTQLDPVEYLFVGSPGLPSGRYYLTANVSGALGSDGIESISGPQLGELRYAVKYVPIQDFTSTNGVIVPVDLAGTTLSDDSHTTVNDIANSRNFYATAGDVEFMGLGTDGKPRGWVFLDGSPGSYPPATTPEEAEYRMRYFERGVAEISPLLSPTSGFGTHTVFVPPMDSGYALCVSLSINNLFPGPNPDLTVNFFDFSQEPDHEYIELTNVSEDTVDVSGWDLEIGIPDRPGVPVDPYKSVWRIPGDTDVASSQKTLIAPGGMILLTANKRDYYRPNGASANSSLIGVNGMGTASGRDPNALTALADLRNVTVPPFADESPRYTQANGFSQSVEAALFDPTGSVFRRIFDPLRGIEPLDYVDRDGDGLTSSYVIDVMLGFNSNETVTSITQLLEGRHSLDTDESVTEQVIRSTADGLDFLADEPWDRIVELQNLRLYVESEDDDGAIALPGIDTVQRVARLVLSGGMLPNYPEHDGHDNDGDGAYVIPQDYLDIDGNGTLDNFLVEDPDNPGVFGIFQQVPIYVPGTLDKDMVDNDLDGWIDERGDMQVFPEGTGFRVLSDPNPYLSEGVDEGRMDSGGVALNGRTFGAGSFEEGTLPVVFFQNRSLYPQEVSWRMARIDPTSTLPFTPPAFENTFMTMLFNNGTVGNTGNPLEIGTKAVNARMFRYDGSTAPAQAADVLERLGNFALGGITYPTGFLSGDAPYLGSRWDPPEWKAFTERRWYPGDNVIVTLYEGPASQGRIADRVTYRELDVTNRTIDDIAASPYRIDGFWSGNPTGGSTLNDPDDVVSLNRDYASMWRPNQMGLDFYRALERKHPMYPGDRFGTTNRWEATDGNYDDWAESPSFFVHGDPTIGAVLTSTLPYEVDLNYRARARFPYLDNFGPVGAAMNRRLLGHAMHGSPLRMNLTHRVSANPDDLISTALVLNLDPAISGSPTLQAFLPLADPSDSQSSITGPAPGGWQGGPQARNFGQFWGSDYSDSSRGDLVVAAAGAPRFGAVENRDWNHEKAYVANKAFQGFGDLMRVPQVGLELRHSPRVPNASATNFLFDATGVNQYLIAADASGNVRPAPPLMRDASLRGATLGQDDTDSSIPKNLLTAAMDGMALNPVVLSVGQAEFTPILPTASAISSDPVGFLDWQLLDGNTLTPPSSWMPVFLFQDLRDLDNTFDGDTTNFPNYPAHFDGTIYNNVFPIYSLFNQAFLFNTPTNGLGSFLYPRANEIDIRDELLPRWPLENRAVMYIAGQSAGVTGDPSLPDALRPEALFTWDAEDGLENGEYLLYVGTFMPGMGQRLLEGDLEALGTPLGLPLLRQLDDDFTLGRDPVVESIIRFDPEQSPGATNLFAPHLALDVITDPSRANGVWDPTGTVGLVPPGNWTPGVQYTPRDDGYIFYGNNAAGGWQPRIVRVTDNYLSLRVRNMGASGQIGVITHVVLSPRKQSPGKINVNTAESRVTRLYHGGNPAGTLQDEIWNPLLGLPGVVDVLSTMDWGPVYTGQYPAPHLRRIGPNDDIGAPFGPDTVPGQAWSDPASIASRNPAVRVNALYSDRDGGGNIVAVPPTANIRNAGDVSFTGTDPLADGYDNTGTARYEDENAALRLSSMIMEGRPATFVAPDGSFRFFDRPDGRYYASPAEMVLNTSAFLRTNNLNLNGAPLPAVDMRTLYPLSNERDASRRFDEAMARIERMGNLITVRSDVFTIQATVQPGYGIDADGDGRVNYRNNAEFITTGERKIRVVYERRAPADRSDQAQP